MYYLADLVVRVFPSLVFEMVLYRSGGGRLRCSVVSGRSRPNQQAKVLFQHMLWLMLVIMKMLTRLTIHRDDISVTI